VRLLLYEDVDEERLLVFGLGRYTRGISDPRSGVAVDSVFECLLVMIEHFTDGS
jgi:hypothetical protein